MIKTSKQKKSKPYLMGLKSQTKHHQALFPKIIPKKIHQISKADISKNAMKVVTHLKEMGFQAYIVGGGIRDLLLNMEPKDFDVATDARPEQIKRIFSNCRLIGRRFRLAHVYFYREIIEVATFRATREVGSNVPTQKGLIIRDNVFGNIDEDVVRRDFTINALYYDPDQEILLDFVNGYEDLKKKHMKIIGDAITRYQEDPVRMLRAIRFAAKLNFKIDAATKKPIPQLAEKLLSISSCRLYDEVLKLFYCGKAYQVFLLLCRYQLFEHLFPILKPYLHQKKTIELIETVLKSTDLRIQQQKPVIAAFLFAGLLWFPFLDFIAQSKSEELSSFYTFHSALNQTLRKASKTITLPNYVRKTIQDIWWLQDYLEHRFQNTVKRTMHKPHFRAAYDFLLYRAQCNKKLQPIAKWWKDFQKAGPDKYQKMIENLVQ
ncbi:MAG: polynucleotide adenylyltransferase PcnB [Gammaproteobacteria bacterium]|nr:polynucleotide adenylyltransferase PcnB [Gammaproteobacteria bacterium]